MFLQMENITKKFPGVLALDKVDFDVQKGEIHALIGENGAGKSTLISLLSGRYQPTAGKISLNQEEVKISKTRTAQNLGISVIYQELNFVPNLNAIQNILLGRETTTKAGFINFAEEAKQVERLIDEMNLELNLYSEMGDLAVAEQQLIEIVKAISLDARILIMDEPTDSLSDSDADNLFQFINKLQERGVTIIYITHRLSEVFEIADRVTVLRDGQKIMTEKVDSVDEDILIKAMVGRDLKEQFPQRKNEKTFEKELLRVENLSITAENNIGRSLENINFSLYEGEILGLSGLIGAGRTELAKAIFGLKKINTGEIYKNGKKININSPKEALNHKIALAPEDRKSEGLVLDMSVIHNMTLASMNKYSSFGFADRNKEEVDAREIIEELRVVTPRLSNKVLNLSGGNQQKIVFAKWLLSDCDILIFDEPTRGIDVGAKKEIYSLINNLADEGKGIIFISSEMPEILGMSDRIVVMCEGRITGEFSKNKVSEEDIMSCAVGHVKETAKTD